MTPTVTMTTMKRAAPRNPEKTVTVVPYCRDLFNNTPSVRTAASYRCCQCHSAPGTGRTPVCPLLAALAELDVVVTPGMETLAASAQGVEGKAKNGTYKSGACEFLAEERQRRSIGNP